MTKEVDVTNTKKSERSNDRLPDLDSACDPSLAKEVDALFARLESVQSEAPPNSELVRLMLQLTLGISEQVEADENAIAQLQEENMVIKEQLTEHAAGNTWQEQRERIAISIDQKDKSAREAMAGGAAAFAKQLDALFNKASGEMYFVFYKVTEKKIPEDQVWLIPSGSDKTATGVNYLTGSQDEIAGGKDADIAVLERIVENPLGDVFPLLWLRYYIALNGGVLRDVQEILDKEDLLRQLTKDRKEREKKEKEIPVYAQALKWVVTSVNKDIRLQSLASGADKRGEFGKFGIGQFRERCNLASAFFGTMVTTIGKDVLTRERQDFSAQATKQARESEKQARESEKQARESEKQARERLALVGDFPHNMNSHIIAKMAKLIDEVQSAASAETRKKLNDDLIDLTEYLKRRTRYLEFMCKFNEGRTKKDRSEFEKVHPSDLKPCSLVNILKHFVKLELFAEYLKAPEKWCDVFSNVLKLKDGDAPCITIRGAVENAIENLCINSLKHGQLKQGQQPGDFKINIVPNSKSDTASVQLMYHDTGKGFDNPSQVKKWLNSSNVNFKSGKGQGIMSIGLSIRAIGGEVDFDEDSLTYMLKIPADLMAALATRQKDGQ